MRRVSGVHISVSVRNQFAVAEAICKFNESKGAGMAKHHRVFIAFAIEDQTVRDLVVGQMRNQNSPFQWTDMSVKQPWATDWKNQCRSRIRGCDGMIAIVSRNTAQASGQLYEIATAREEKIPLVGLHATRDQRPLVLPPALNGVRIMDWSWENISGFLRSL